MSKNFAFSAYYRADRIRGFVGRFFLVVVDGYLLVEFTLHRFLRWAIARSLKNDIPRELSWQRQLGTGIVLMLGNRDSLWRP